MPKKPFIRSRLLFIIPHLIYSTLILGMEIYLANWKKKMQYKNRFTVNILHQHLHFGLVVYTKLRCLTLIKVNTYQSAVSLYIQGLSIISVVNLFLSRSHNVDPLLYRFYQNKKDLSVQNDDKCKRDWFNSCDSSNITN